jgi:type I restriction enzyme, S subunit
MTHFEARGDGLGPNWCVPRHYTRLHHGLPSHAVRKHLYEIAEIASGSYVREYATTGVPYLRVDNIRPFQINETPEDLVYVDPSRQGERSVVSDGDVLIARTGTLGKAAPALKRQAGWIMSQHVSRIRVKEDVAGYVACCLNLALGREQLFSNAFGSTRPELTHSALRAIWIPWAPRPIRNAVHELVMEGTTDAGRGSDRISRAIREFDAIVSQRPAHHVRPLCFDAKLTAATRLWTPQFHRPDHQAAVADLSEQFHCVPLGTIAHIRRGKGTRTTDYARSGVPFIRTSSLMNFGIDPFPDHYASEETVASYDQPTKAGDILLSIEGRIGISALALDGQDCVLKNHIELIRLHPEFDPTHVFLMLNTRAIKRQLRMLTVIQATLPGLASRSRELVIPLTPLNGDSSISVRLRKAIDTAREGFELRRCAVTKWQKAIAIVDDYVGRSTV